MEKLVSLSMRALLETPAMQPPQGITPNFDNPPNRNRLAYGVTLTSAVLTGVLVLFRLYARAFYHRSIVLEDYIAVAAVGVFSGFLYACWKIIDHPGAFVHQWDVRMQDLPHLLYYYKIATILYGAVATLIKVAILLEWIRLFAPQGINNKFRWTCYIILFINIVMYIICLFVEIFACSLRPKTWQPTVQGKCLDMSKLQVVSPTLTFISDIIILILPQKVIWALHMTTRKKLGVASLFGVGILACACASIRIHSGIKYASSGDILYNISYMGLWCMAEMVLGSFVLCLPALPKLFAESPWMRKFLTWIKFFSKFTSRNQPGSSRTISTQYRGRTGSQVQLRSLFLDSEGSDIRSLTNASAESGLTAEVNIESRSSIRDDRTFSARIL